MNIPILSIPSAEYHAESRNGHYLSSRLLAAFRESPELYRRKTNGEIDAASALLDDGAPEDVIRTEYCHVHCQIRMDWFSEKHGIVDLKTCDSLKWFEDDCKRFGYVFQMAFYRAVLREATGETVPVHIVAVEKNEPFSTGVWELTGGRPRPGREG